MTSLGFTLRFGPQRPTPAEPASAARCPTPGQYLCDDGLLRQSEGASLHAAREELRVSLCDAWRFLQQLVMC